MSYSIDKIRNIVLLGHGSSGKTSLAESMLFITGAIDRQGKVVDGNTVCDYDAEEIKRKISISATIAPIEYKGYKINVIDTPGFFDFAGEVSCALAAADFGVIVCSAKDGITVGAERAYKKLKSAGIPFMFYISKCDEDNSDCMGVIDSIKAKYGLSLIHI